MLNIADMRTVHSRDALAALKDHFGEKVFDTVIRSSIAYAESAEKATSILDHRPDLGADYLELAEHAPDAPRRAEAVQGVRAVLIAAVAVVRTVAPGL